MSYPAKAQPTGVVAALLPAIDAVLGVRDSIGAIIRPVYMVTRTWMGSEAGAGTATDSVVPLLPSPGMKEFAQDIRLREGGVVKAGDIILTNISANKYTEESLGSVTGSKNVERFFLVGDKLYTVINISKKYVTFNVQVREHTDQRRY